MQSYHGEHCEIPAARGNSIEARSESLEITSWSSRLEASNSTSYREVERHPERENIMRERVRTRREGTSDEGGFQQHLLSFRHQLANCSPLSCTMAEASSSSLPVRTRLVHPCAAPTLTRSPLPFQVGRPSVRGRLLPPRSARQAQSRGGESDAGYARRPGELEDGREGRVDRKSVV